MEKSEETKSIKRAMLALIDKLKEHVMEDCDDDDIAFALAKFSPQRYGYVKEDEYINYEKAQAILCISNNRTKLNELCKMYGIKNHKINNMPVGFKRSEIERLAVILEEKRKKDGKKPKLQRRFGQKYSIMDYDF